MSWLSNFSGSLDIFFVFLIILLRVSSIIVFAPIFSSSSIPAQVKVAFALIFSVVLYPSANQYIHVTDFSVLNIAVTVIRELILSVALGFCIHFVWAGIELGAQLVGFMMGFSIANVLSPEENLQISILAEFESIMAVLIFLIIDGHHIFIRAMADSFKMVPVGEFVLNQNVFDILMKLTAMMFGVSFKILAPAIIALVVTNVVFGIIARMMPQMNIMIAAFPLSIGIGLFVLGVSFSYSAYVVAKYYNSALSYVYALLGGG
jgi:flagellar biosynthetic protein FliR